VITDDRGTRMFLCSDTDYCEAQRERSRQTGVAASPASPKETPRA